MSPGPRCAYSYLRFSTPEQMKGDSLRRQAAAAAAYAATHGLTLMEVSYQDLGVSAYRGANAESGALSQFLEAVEAGSIPRGSFLLVESLDRISRDKVRKAMRTLEAICDAGITVVTLMDGKVYDTAILDNDPMALMYLIVVAMRANEESATKSRRLKDAWANKRRLASTRILTSRAPTWLKVVGEGHNRKFAVVEQRAAVIRRIFELASQGVGQNKIAATLNLEHVATLDGGKVWYRSNIAKLLDAEAVIGTYVPHEIDVGGNGRKLRKPVGKIEGYYPAIVDAELFAAVRALALDTKNPLRGRHAHGELRSVLGGLARCPVCDGTMTRVTKGSSSKAGKPYLVCVRAKQGGGCTYKAVKLDSIEEALKGAAGLIVGTAPVNEGESDLQRELEGVFEALKALEDEIEELVAAYVNTRSPAIQSRLSRAEADHDVLELKYRELSDRIADVQGPLLKNRLA